MHWLEFHQMLPVTHGCSHCCGRVFCDDENSLSYREDYHENVLTPMMELLAVKNIHWVPFCCRECPLSSQRPEFKEHFDVHWSITYTHDN